MGAAPGWDTETTYSKASVSIQTVHLIARVVALENGQHHRALDGASVSPRAHLAFEDRWAL